MSRHSIPSKDPNHTVVIGWDAPLQTFFAQVDREVETDDDDTDPESIVDEGNRYRQHPTLDKLLTLVAPYAVVPEATKLQLANDKANSTKPSALQMAIIADFSHQEQSRLELSRQEFEAKMTDETRSPAADTTIATFSRCQHSYGAGAAFVEM